MTVLWTLYGAQLRILLVKRVYRLFWLLIFLIAISLNVSDLNFLYNRWVLDINNWLRTNLRKWIIFFNRHALLFAIYLIIKWKIDNYQKNIIIILFTFLKIKEQMIKILEENQYCYFPIALFSVLNLCIIEFLFLWIFILLVCIYIALYSSSSSSVFCCIFRPCYGESTYDGGYFHQKYDLSLWKILRDIRRLVHIIIFG